MNLQLPLQERLKKIRGNKVSNQQNGVLLEEVAGFGERKREWATVLVTAGIWYWEKLMMPYARKYVIMGMIAQCRTAFLMLRQDEKAVKVVEVAVQRDVRD